MRTKSHKNKHKRVLVLNADYRAISVTGWQNAITSEFKGITDTIVDYEDTIQLPNDFGYPAPAVIRLKKQKKVHKRRVPFSRKNVFIRDRLNCQYCGNRFHYRDLTFDHVVPRSKWNPKNGSPTVWTNIVSCCYDCNHRKGHMSLKEAGMKLIKEPIEPDPFLYINGLAPWTLLQPEWIDYIPTHYKDLLDTAPAG